MSMYLEFEPHSWYKGFAIKKGATYALDQHHWEAYSDDGLTYTIITIRGNTLRDLKAEVTRYLDRQRARQVELYQRLENKEAGNA